MNNYGESARSHWAKTDPARLAAIEDPETFVQTLGEHTGALSQSSATPGGSHRRKSWCLRRSRFGEPVV
jgi:hypothetical protein